MAVKSLLNWLDPIRLDEREKFLKKSVTHLIGASPSNLTLYRLAFLHSSASKESVSENYKESNERLEFLGDSVLGMITATNFPSKTKAS
jgi:ribonuclease III